MTIKYYQPQKILSRVSYWGKLFNLSLIKFFYKIEPLIYGFFYNLFWFLFRQIFSFFLRLKVESKVKNLKKLKPPLIIASNHIFRLDSFIIGAAFPFASKIFPIRYACWYKYYYSPRYYIFARIFGSFPVRKGLPLEENLSAAVRILKNNGVIGIFPEGTRVKKGRPPKGRRGCAFLALKTKTKVLPVKIKAPKIIKWKDLLLRKYTVEVKIGRPFSLQSAGFYKPYDYKELTEASNFIMGKIRSL